jgi:hypothetical protein
VPGYYEPVPPGQNFDFTSLRTAAFPLQYAIFGRIIVRIAIWVGGRLEAVDAPRSAWRADLRFLVGSGAENA